MSSWIAGLSWVTPLGSGVDTVWQRLLAGERPPLEKLQSEHNAASYLVHRVPDHATKNLPPHPRLRRASAISRFAAAAGLGAIADVEVAPNLARTAVVFAISNGGVIYTRRFYSEIVKAGAQAASPLLFRKLSSMPLRVIWLRFSASGARLIPLSETARSVFLR